MRRLSFTLCGESVPVYVVTSLDDIELFEEWLERPRQALAVDTETTGVDIYARDFRLRLVQFGDTESAWVLPIETMPELRDAVSYALDAHRLVLHNADFDLQIFDHEGISKMERLWPKTVDTQIYSHLIDPRASQEGGVGHGLKELCTVWVDASAPDGQAALKAEFKAMKCKISDGFARIAIDNPEYLRYAGADCVLTARLLEVLEPIVMSKGWNQLAIFEHELAAAIGKIERRGMLLNVDYAETLKQDLIREEEEGQADAARFGVANVNAPRQVAAALQGMGADLSERTPTGSPKVDRAVLTALAGSGNPLAAAITKAKRAGKYRTSYVESCLKSRDEADRVHPSIRALQARTARMSVSTPPLQQLPSKERRIREMFIADPGFHIISCDYAQVELRVLAVLAEELKMIEAIKTGADLHSFTASLMFGKDFTKLQRDLAKVAAFGRVYGGGKKVLARQTGVSLAVAGHVVELFDNTYPGIKRYAKYLEDRATFSGDRAVVTPTGRRLPLDGDRMYAALNYQIQSTARDVMAQAILDVDYAGLGGYVLMPIHDEILGQAPIEQAKDIAQRIADVMTVKNFLGSGIDLVADADVYGQSWGEGY